MAGDRTATIKDVAREAGLSIATVSRAFHNPHLLSSSTREAVEGAIAALDYRPRFAAQGLRGTRTNLVLVVVPSLSPCFLNIFAGAEEAAVASGYGVLVGHSDRDPARERHFVDQVAAGRADGLILVTSVADYDAAEASAMPPTVVALGVSGRSQLPTVRIDHVGAARRMTDYLLDIGHRRIAHVLGEQRSLLSADRLEGYKQALAARGIPFDPALCPRGDFTVESGEAAAEVLLALDTPPTAVFAGSDHMAIGVLRRFREAGLRVPQDVSVTGFDDERLAALATPALSTVKIPTYEIGLTAMRQMTRTLNGESIEREVILDADLLIRRSAQPIGHA